MKLRAAAEILTQIEICDEDSPRIMVRLPSKRHESLWMLRRKPRLPRGSVHSNSAARSIGSSRNWSVELWSSEICVTGKREY
jgi:hypothetical protein